MRLEFYPDSSDLYHEKYNEYGSKEIESVKGRYGREGSVKYMVVGKVRSQSGDCL